MIIVVPYFRLYAIAYSGFLVGSEVASVSVLLVVENRFRLRRNWKSEVNTLIIFKRLSYLKKKFHYL